MDTSGKLHGVYLYPQQEQEMYLKVEFARHRIATLNDEQNQYSVRNKYTVNDVVLWTGWTKKFSDRHSLLEFMCDPEEDLEKYKDAVDLTVTDSHEFSLTP